MMFPKVSFSILFIIWSEILGIRAQLCVPNPIEDLDFSLDRILSWSASQNCPNTQYTIRISTGGIIEYEYTTEDLNLDLSFLAYCRPYNFSITPFSDHIMGMEIFMEGSTALPIEVDITILNFTVSPIDNDLLLQWRVSEQYTSCVMFYGVRRWDEDADSPETVNVYDGLQGHFLEYVPQCMKYRFEVTAYYSRRNGTPGEYEYTVPAATNTPSLVELRQDSTTINTTWSLEKYYENRCPVSTLYINGTHFNVTYPIEDVPERPDVLVSISGLRPNSMYYFQVSTENNAGLSNPVQIAVQTLPLDPNFY